MPPKEIDIEDEKQEIWKDLSTIYFKYDDETWRKAFREFVIELHEKIGEVKWDEIYNRIYREEE